MAVIRTEHDGRPAYRWEALDKAYGWSEGDEAGESYARKRAFLDGVVAGDTGSMTADEIRAAARVSAALGFRKASQTDPDPGSMMIAWYPPADLAKGLTVPGGEATEDLHMTIVHLPKEVAADPRVVEAVALLESQHHAALDGCISGTGRFVIDDTTDCFYASVDVPGLEDLRECIIDSLCRAGIVWEQTHGFTPHITLKYLDRADPDPGRLDGQVEIDLDSISFATPAGGHVDYPLSAEAEADADAEVSKRVQAAIGDKPHATDAQNLPEPELEYSIVHRGADPNPEGEAEPTGDQTDEGNEWQYTLGMLYAPSQKDAHGEYAEDDTLHKAVIQYSLASAKDPTMRRMKMQHDPSVESGTWVELMRLPADMTTTVTKADGTQTEMTFPKGAVMMGVIWDDDAWAMVKDGSLGGLSLGGRAVRVANGDRGAAIKESMGYSKAPKQEKR